MARKEERRCYFDGANGCRGSTWIPLLFVVLCALLAGSLAVAEHGECVCACMYVARRHVHKCHLHICVHMRHGKRAHERLSITCCVSEDSFRNGRGRRKRDVSDGRVCRRKRNSGGAMERTSRREQPTSETLCIFFSKQPFKIKHTEFFAKERQNGRSDNKKLPKILGIDR